MRIAVLGTGRFATDFAPALVRARHEVVFGSRAPDVAGRSERPTLPGPTRSHAAAVAGADLVVNALPGAVALELLPTLADELADAVLLDASNAFEDDGSLTFPNSSVGERLQALLPRTRVVKALNHVAGYVAADPSSLGGPSTVFLSGDDDTAKRFVRSVLVEIGWSNDTHVDLGGIETARATEHLGLLFWALVQKYGTGEFGHRLVLAPGVAPAADRSAPEDPAT